MASLLPRAVKLPRGEISGSIGEDDAADCVGGCAQFAPRGQVG